MALTKDSKAAVVKPPAISTPAAKSEASVTPPAVVESPAVVDTSVPNDDGSWVDPATEGATVTDAPAVVEAPEAIVTDAPVVDPSAPTSPTTVETKPAAATETAPALDAAPVTPVAVEPPKPVAPANPYDPNETIRVMEGVEWSRTQLVNALNVGVGAKTEADAFRSVFSCTAAEAQETWKPLVDDIKNDPKFADYLQRAIDHYKTETAGAAPQPTAQPQYAQLDPALRNELAGVLAWKQQQDSERQRALYADHERTAFAEHPILKADPQVYAMVAQRTQYRISNGNPNYTLLDGVRELAPWLQEQTMLRAARVAAIAPATPVADIPALNAGAGAAPAATRSTTTRIRPQSFKTLDDATADWIDNGARAAGFN